MADTNDMRDEADRQLRDAEDRAEELKEAADDADRVNEESTSQDT